MTYFATTALFFSIVYDKNRQQTPHDETGHLDQWARRALKEYKLSQICISAFLMYLSLYAI